MAPVSTVFELDVEAGMGEDVFVGVGVGVVVLVVEGTEIEDAEDTIVVLMTVVEIAKVELVVCKEAEVKVCVTAELVLVARFVLVGTPGSWLTTIGTKSPRAPSSRLEHMTPIPGCVN
jgi:hypothetical protein